MVLQQRLTVDVKSAGALMAANVLSTLIPLRPGSSALLGFSACCVAPIPNATSKKKAEEVAEKSAASKPRCSNSWPQVLTPKAFNVCSMTCGVVTNVDQVCVAIQYCKSCNTALHRAGTGKELNNELTVTTIWHAFKSWICMHHCLCVT